MKQRMWHAYNCVSFMPKRPWNFTKADWAAW